MPGEVVVGNGVRSGRFWRSKGKVAERSAIWTSPACAPPLQLGSPRWPRGDHTSGVRYRFDPIEATCPSFYGSTQHSGGLQ